MTTSEAFSSVQVTRLEVGLAALRLYREAARLRVVLGVRPDEAFRGTYISHDDLNRIITSGSTMDVVMDRRLPIPEDLASLDSSIFEVERALHAARTAASPGDRWLRLATRLELSHAAQALLALAVACAVDPALERLCAYLNDDVQRRRPTLDLGLRMLARDLWDRGQLLGEFDPRSPLLAWSLVRVDPGSSERVGSPLHRSFEVEPRILSYLLGDSRVERELQPWIAGREVFGHDNAIPDDILARCASLGAPGEPRVLILVGRPGEGRERAAASIAAATRRELMLLRPPSRPVAPGALADAFRLAEREALLEDRLPCWVDVTGGAQEETHRALFHELLGRTRAPALVLTPRVSSLDQANGQRGVVRLDLPRPSGAVHKATWIAELGVASHDADSLVARYRLSGDQIRRVVAGARAQAKLMRGAAAPSLPELEAACRAEVQPNLHTLAERVALGPGWDDLVLQSGPLTQLKQIVAAVRQRVRVLEEWGYGRRLTYGRGILTLFAGPSGTGKTLAASVTALELGMDLYKVDISSVVSKYIGETEKNLESIFREAQESDAILFFDEADALFGKRGEVSDARDRYANLEVAYLLQRTEAYDGLVILATNLRRNLDEAFLRRLRFSIDFALPEEPERVRIWRLAIPHEAPVEDELRLEELARLYKLAGGGIRNASLAAAYRAADEGRGLRMADMHWAATLELQKMGRVTSGSTPR